MTFRTLGDKAAALLAQLRADVLVWRRQQFESALFYLMHGPVVETTTERRAS